MFSTKYSNCTQMTFFVRKDYWKHYCDFLQITILNFAINTLKSSRKNNVKKFLLYDLKVIVGMENCGTVTILFVIDILSTWG